MNIKDMKFGEIERFCLEQFDANSDLFKTVVKDNIEKTIDTISTMGREGMKQTDEEILSLMLSD